MRLAVFVIGGIVVGGYAAAQMSGDLAIIGMIAGGAIGGIAARRLGGDADKSGDEGAWCDGTEQGNDNDGWDGDDGGD